MPSNLILANATLLILSLAAAVSPGRLTATLALIAAGIAATLGWRFLQRADRRIVYLEGALDAVPQPLTVTDLEMRWVFINKTTEGLLRRSRKEAMGRHCSEWQAHICRTDKCGINSLRRGVPRTTYSQAMGDGTSRTMQVDTSYIVDGLGRRIGHIEIVTDVEERERLTELSAKLAASLEEMTGTMTEIESQTRTNASGASEANTVAAATRQTLEEGEARIRQLQEAMGAITDTSREIKKINKIIDEIAFQTNLLALNAAVEAARAGEAGAGFAVVADEVRELASRAADAARQTSELIERSTAAVAQGGELAGQVTESLGDVNVKAGSVSRLVEGIAHACGEQVQGIAAVTEALARLGQTASSSDRPAELVKIARR